MPTILSTLYPPLIETFMPAFPCGGPAPVTFSFSPYNSMSEIKRIHVSMVSQSTNQNVFKNKLDGYTLVNNIWIIDIGKVDSNILTIDSNLNKITIRIPKVLLKSNEDFVINDYYKVQIRFDTSTVIVDGTNYLIDYRYNFSEWSSVCLIKAIPNIELGMVGFDTNTNNITNSNVLSSIRSVQIGIVPISGQLIFNYNNAASTKDQETMQKYKIVITNEDEEIIDSSGWVYTGNNIDPNRIYWLADITNATENTLYNMKIDIVTKNQYSFSKKYQMRTTAWDVINFSPQWTFQKVQHSEFEEWPETDQSYIATKEDGYVHFNITSDEDLPQGFLYIKRASSLDNFKNWELLSCTKNVGTINKNFTDPTVGSLVKYRYACQYRVKKNGMWTKNYFSEYVYPNYHDILIMRQGKQLAIRYNEQITSYTPVVNRQVINTLGGRYPKFAENANMHYRKFTLSGLITAEADYNRKFLNDRDYASQMNDYDSFEDGRYEMRNDTIPDGTLTYALMSGYPATKAATRRLTYNSLHDLYPKDNWWWEREFRDQAIEWLNDGEPKLFRSMTEGNMVVMLTDISLTPNTQLGRRTYNISMTAYEVEDGYSLDVLSTLGIVTIPDEYSSMIEGGIADDDTDSDDSEDGTIEEFIVGQMYQKTGHSNNDALIYYEDINVEPARINEYTLNDIYNGLYYQGANSMYKIIESSFQLLDLRIQFESPPKWYDLAATPQPQLVDIKEAEKNSSSTENYFLGYKIGLNVDGEKIIFVNEKGYYQVPSNLIVTNITIYDRAQATLDFKLKYKKTYDESSLPSAAEFSEKIIGQLSGFWVPGQTIANTIKKKYDYYKKSSNEKEGFKGLLERQYLDSITAFGFDGTSYSVLDITFEGDETTNSIVVGRTGVYDLITDYPIEDVTFKGRRMVRLDNPEYNRYLTTSYILDASTTGYQPLVDSPLTWINTDTGQQVTDVVVVINGNESTPERNQIVRNFIQTETQKPYNSTDEIDNPKVNTIYGVYSRGEVILMLYQANGWVNISLESSGNSAIINAVEQNKVIRTGKKRYNLAEWEFSLDNSANPDYQEDKLKWYKSFIGKTNLDVNVTSYGEKTTQYTANQKIKRVDEIPSIDGYKSVQDIKNPEYNTVYKIQNGEDQPPVYMIYYINHSWYEVKFLDKEHTVILAKVPVNGMVNYRGTLVTTRYE